jgi:hypothetical protein
MGAGSGPCSLAIRWDTARRAAPAVISKSPCYRVPEGRWTRIISLYFHRLLCGRIETLPLTYANLAESGLTRQLVTASGLLGLGMGSLSQVSRNNTNGIKSVFAQQIP